MPRGYPVGHPGGYVPSFVVNATGRPPQTVGAANWLEALGKALDRLGLVGGLERLACEILPNQTVVARDARTGMGFVVMEAHGAGTPAPTERRQGGPESDPFAVRNLPLSVFHANLGHELRTPVNDVLGYAGMLMEEAHDRNLPHMAEDLRKLHQVASGLLELIDAGLDAARLATDEPTRQRLTFQVVELLEDAAAAFQLEATRRRNQVEIHALPELGEMRADPVQLRSALIELLRWSNERVREGVIHLDAELSVDAEKAEWVALTVSDNGAPPTDDEIAGLFEVMASSGGPTGTAARTIRRGTCRELVRGQGGEIAAVAVRNTRALVIRIPRGR